MLTLSREVKNAIKLALALTIAYGISFYQDWANPYWAAFAIIFTNHSALGQSVGKAIQRLAGTIIATIFAFIIMALFIHNQWLFMLALSLYLLFFSYLCTGKKIPNLYKVTGFVCMVICISNSINSTNTFHAATLRILQTGMGIAIATIVNLLVWPEASSQRLITLTSTLLENARDQYKKNYDWIIRKKRYTDKDRLHIQARKMLIEFSEVLSGSTIDTPELMIKKKKWHYFADTLMQLFNEIEILRESRRKLENVAIKKIFINIAEVDLLIHKRITYLIERCSKRLPYTDFNTIKLESVPQELEKLSPLDRSTVEIIRQRVDNITYLCQELVECLALTKKKYPVNKNTEKHSFPIIDRERLIPAIRVVMTLWATFLIWKYTRIPGNTGFITMGTSFALGFLTSPKTPVTSVLKPAAISCICASIGYIFIIPQLNSYFSLAIVIFFFSFTIAYLFRKPQQTLSKLFCLAMTFAIVSITNPQQHLFLSLANKTIMFAIILLLLIIMSSLPESMYPGNVVFRLINSYWKNISSWFRCTDKSKTNIFTYHFQKSVPELTVMLLPDKLNDWTAAINTKRFPEIPATELDEINDIIRAVSIHTAKAELITSSISRDKLFNILENEFNSYKDKISATFSFFSKKQTANNEMKYQEILKYQQEANTKIGNIVSFHQHWTDNLQTDINKIYLLLGHYNAVITAIQRYLKILQRTNISILKEFRI